MVDEPSPKQGIIASGMMGLLEVPPRRDWMSGETMSVRLSRWCLCRYGVDGDID